MSKEVQSRVRELAGEVAGILNDLPESLTIGKYELDKSYSTFEVETFRLILNGTTLFVSVQKNKEAA